MSAARVIESIRPHIPLIKFRFIKGAIGSVAMGTSKPKSNSSTLKVSTRRGESIDFIHLPLRYRRMTITPDEMDFINRGGPE